ncbi:hypothetical protein LI82_07375 [Methanococcoides methylutens]|uniref:Transposase IS204/IS1001/IS1096/IS1165 DDE domain-containing protein n=1 Tax=Methanococcoides methylutens TaxID=2226 RepID=A0A099T1A4_METMT|nr:hypothetical protein LI82_07375 [Methanococcoides methylutens]
MDLSGLDTIGVDKISVKKSHSFVILFYDLNISRVIHIGNGKKRSVFKNFRAILSKKINPDNIQYISMDMYPARTRNFICSRSTRNWHMENNVVTRSITTVNTIKT